ncbi:efflux RND transporter periplasmic adaptor subunit [Gynuella sunshinyii]|uniref:Membrane-fusion protein n=1 Tax=Gynuella sunshinyii YC6258 TaxID=1445510 RepID=A0A0C5VM21_9GAMM|nr:efflux RND transporter periplasmic adaptor subunit [Gynuella sunshinyii]AJQ95356.1 membrane-fusion protein [Gynuella sunshinyii YC6258]
MKINVGVVVAWFIALSLTGWIISGSFASTSPPAETDTQLTQTEKTARVQASVLNAKLITKTLTLNGQTVAKRVVDIKAESTGKIIELNVEKGDWVKAGTILMKLDPNDLDSQLKSAKALESQRKMEYDGAVQLNKQGLQNATQLAGTLTLYEQAKAATESLKIQLQDTVVKAPFDGYVNNRNAELGSYVTTGTEVIELISFSPMLISVQVSENNIAAIQLGQTAKAKLVDDTEVEGKISFISASSNPATRTFQVEMEVTTPVAQPVAGASATLELPIKSAMAHYISPALLILDDNGQLGIKTINDQNVVEFHNVSLAETTPRGIWVTGLPSTTKVITVGQGFVKVGETVEPTFETDAEPEQDNSAISKIQG